MSAWLARSLGSGGHTWVRIAIYHFVGQGRPSQRPIVQSSSGPWYIWTACRRHWGLTAGQPLQCQEWKRPLGAVKYLDSMQEAWGTFQPLLRRSCLGSSQHGAEPNECPLILIAGKMSSALFDALEDYLTSYLCVKSAMYWTSYLCIEPSIYQTIYLSIEPAIYRTIYLSIRRW